MTTRIALSLGCPSGVGPEVAAVAALGMSGAAKILLVGDVGIVLRAARGRGLDAGRFCAVATPEEGFALQERIGVFTPSGGDIADEGAPLGAPTRDGGRAQLAWIDGALDLVRLGQAHALVTGPANKAAVASSGAPGAAEFLGHTEHLQRRLGAAEVVMAFASPALVTSLVSTHLPLRDVAAAVTPEAVSRATYWLADLILALEVSKETREDRKRPSIAVASLNPHAGEGGLLGAEESRAIVPGIEGARLRLGERAAAVDLVGPVPAESAFRLASKGRFQGVVAMYHDQATIPMKLLAFGEAVNVSLGLGLVRTSVDHGTAYDVAPRFVADASGMIEAIRLAAKLAG